jgi:hypothetical protein
MFATADFHRYYGDDDTSHLLPGPGRSGHQIRLFGAAGFRRRFRRNHANNGGYGIRLRCSFNGQ